MPYPVDIPPAVTGYSVGTNGTRGRFQFEYSGAWYLFLDRNSPGGSSAAAGDFHIHALKSTDLGQTWTELDSANAPPSNPAAPDHLVSGVGDCYTVFRDGATAWLLTIRVDDTQIIQGITATPFNLSGGGSWGAPTDYTSPLPDYMANSGGGGSQLMLSGAVCGPANYQVLMSGTSETIAGHRYTRSWIASFDGSIWGSAVEIPGQAGNAHNYAPVSAQGDDDGRAHFIYLADEHNFPTTFGAKLYHVGLDSDGVTFGTSQALTPNFYFETNNVIGTCSELILFSGTLALAAEINNDSGSTTQSIQLFCATAALDPTWADTPATTGVDGVDPSLPDPDFRNWIPAALTLGYANGSLVLAWAVHLNPFFAIPDSYWSTQSPYPAFSWATPAQLFLPSISGNVGAQVTSFTASGGVAIVGCSFAPSGPEEDANLLAQIYLVPIGGARLLPNRIKLPGQIF